MPAPEDVPVAIPPGASALLLVVPRASVRDRAASRRGASPPRSQARRDEYSIEALGHTARYRSPSHPELGRLPSDVGFFKTPFVAGVARPRRPVPLQVDRDPDGVGRLRANLPAGHGPGSGLISAAQRTRKAPR